jgi:hypothetical protein
LLIIADGYAREVLNVPEDVFVTAAAASFTFAGRAGVFRCASRHGNASGKCITGQHDPHHRGL